jgi:hypothetical protein
MRTVTGLAESTVNDTWSLESLMTWRVLCAGEAPEAAEAPEATEATEVEVMV